MGRLNIFSPKTNIMNTSLQELTDKIYQEGVTKGNAEAKDIVAAAKKEAEAIIKNAEEEAQKRLQKAKKESDEMQKTALSELQMAAQKAMGALKLEISRMIDGEIINSTVKAATTDVKFMQKIMEMLIKNRFSNDEDVPEMRIIVPEKDEKSIKDYFAKAAKGVLDKGFTIESANNIKAGFQVAPADGSYKISFTDADFMAFFKAFVREKIATLLFKA